MAEIKVIWGPSSKTCREDRLAWSFSGLRTNGEYARWHLAFWFDSRRFSTKALPGHPGDEEKAAKLAALPVATPPLSGRFAGTAVETSSLFTISKLCVPGPTDSTVQCAGSTTNFVATPSIVFATLTVCRFIRNFFVRILSYVSHP